MTYSLDSFDRLIKYTILCIGMMVEETHIYIILAILVRRVKKKKAR